MSERESQNPSLPPLDMISEVVGGRYRVERLIARGGMGTVYLARQLELNRMVALKVLTPGSESDDGGSFEERFRLEAETLGNLSHPHIVTLYDYGETADGRFFLALEYIEGPRFTDILRGGPMDPKRTISLILQVCRALRYAHKRGVVHRDLKPSNLLIGRDDDGAEHVKVVDFGLVKVLEDDQSLTRAGLILGSPHCMSPEQIRGADIDHRADLYAIGILLFRALTGKWPFHGESSTATMIAHINNPVPAFAAVAPDQRFPPGLEAAVRRCLEKDVERRFADVGALMIELSACFPSMSGDAGASINEASPQASTGSGSVELSRVDAPSVVAAGLEPTVPLRAEPERSPWGMVVAGALVVLVLAVAVCAGAYGVGFLGPAESPVAEPTLAPPPVEAEPAPVEVAPPVEAPPPEPPLPAPAEAAKPAPAKAAKAAKSPPAAKTAEPPKKKAEPAPEAPTGYAGLPEDL